MIDPAVVEDIRSHVRGISTSARRRTLISDLREHLSLGEDGLWFVDYIGSVSKVIGNQAYVISALCRYRQLIIEKANELDAKSRELPKYLWLVHYHNKSAKQLFPSRRDLKITRSDVPASDEFLRRRSQIKLPPKTGVKKKQQARPS